MYKAISTIGSECSHEVDGQGGSLEYVSTRACWVLGEVGGTDELTDEENDG